MAQPATERPHVVIVGAGFGGLQAARALRSAPVRVTVIDRSNHHLFQPLLYQVATAGLSPADIAEPIRSILRRQQNTEVVMAEVSGVDTQARRVIMHDRSLHYDYLILATGATDSYFGHDEWAAYAPGLKSISEATSIRRDILAAFEAAEIEPDPERRRSLLTFVLVGAGPTGVEMSGAISELAHRALTMDFRHIDPSSARVLLLEAGPRILASFPEELARAAQSMLEKLGVEVRVGARVENVDERGVMVSEQRIEAGTVIWTAGVRASSAGQWLGAEVDKAGRVKVQADLSVPGAPEVFVIGDTAHTEQDGKQLPGLAPVAMQQGRYVAALVRRRVRGEPAPPPFHYLDKGNLATVGRSFAILDFHGLKLSGFLAWLGWIAVHIYYLIGFRNRLLVLIQWAWAYLTFQRGARVIQVATNSGTPEDLLRRLPAEEAAPVPERADAGKERVG